MKVTSLPWDQTKTVHDYPKIRILNDLGSTSKRSFAPFATAKKRYLFRNERLDCGRMCCIHKYICRYESTSKKQKTWEFIIAAVLQSICEEGKLARLFMTHIARDRHASTIDVPEKSKTIFIIMISCRTAAKDGGNTWRQLVSIETEIADCHDESFSQDATRELGLNWNNYVSHTCFSNLII